MDEIVRDFKADRNAGVPVPSTCYCRRDEEFLARRVQQRLLLEGITLALKYDDEYPPGLWFIDKQTLGKMKTARPQ